MKRLQITIVLILMSLVSFSQPDSIKQLFEKANGLYEKDSFSSAIDFYNKIISYNYSSPELFYNTGNAYFKSNQIPKSILFYEKALKLSPNNEDIKFNLEFANLYVKDEFTPVPEFFIDKFFKNFITSFSSNFWAITSIVTFLGVLVLIMIFLFSKTNKVRKLTFFASIFIFFISASTLFFSIKNKNYFTDSKQAIVMEISTLKSSPKEDGTDLIIINPGVKVNVQDSNNEWFEVKLPNGVKGWIKNKAVEKI